MATLQKYLFDMDFGEVERPVLIEEEILEPQDEPPTFSEEEVEAANQAGFTVGHQQGIAETLSDIDSQTTEVLGTIASELSKLFKVQAETNDELSADALNLVMSISRRLLPDLSAKNGLGEVTRVSQILLERLLTEPRIEIRVNESLAEPLNDTLAPFLEQRGFKGDLVMLGDGDLAVGECKLTWSSGSADRDIERLWQGIETAVKDSLLTQKAMEEAEEAAAQRATAQTQPDVSEKLGDTKTSDILEEGHNSEAEFANESAGQAAPPEAAPIESHDTLDVPPTTEIESTSEPIEELAVSDGTPNLDETTDLNLSEASTSPDLSVSAPLADPQFEPAESGIQEAPPASTAPGRTGTPLLGELDGYDPNLNDDPGVVDVGGDDDIDPKLNDPQGRGK